MTFDSNEMARRIQSLRKKAGISQIQLSFALHVSRDVITKIETGARMPSLDLVVQLASYFSVSTDYLLTGSTGNESVVTALSDVITRLNSIKESL